MASNIQAEINKRNKGISDKLWSWFSTYIDKVSSGSATRRGKPISTTKAKELVKESVEKTGSLTDAKKDLKATIAPVIEDFNASVKGAKTTVANKKAGKANFVGKMKKSVKDARKKSAEKGIEDLNKTVTGAKSAVAKRKDVEKLDDDAIKAKRRADAKKESKNQPDGPGSAPKASKKKEGKSVKESLKDQIFKQGKRKYGPLTVDSTDEGMSKFLGTKEEIERQEMEEEMNLRKGGTARRKAFGKGGMYKAPKKAYGMKKGGFTRRGASR